MRYFTVCPCGVPVSQQVLKVLLHLFHKCYSKIRKYAKTVTRIMESTDKLSYVE